MKFGTVIRPENFDSSVGEQNVFEKKSVGNAVRLT